MNAVNWTLWLLLAMAYCAFTYNPLYQLLLFTVLASVAASYKQPMKSYVKVGLLVSAIPLFVNTFLVHGGDTVLYTVPYRLDLFGVKIPSLVFAGPITLESVSTGLIMTVFLVNMLTAFQIFNNTTSPDAILRLIPSQLPGVALATSISMRFMPTVLRDHSSIRDAQASRGVRFDSGSLVERTKNNVSTLVPTVVTSLERGFNLSDSMVSRAYTGRRTSYRKTTWGLGEKLHAALAVLAGAYALYMKSSGLLDYWPYDGITPIPFSAAAVFPLLVLTLPIFKHERDRTQ